MTIIDITVEAIESSPLFSSFLGNLLAGLIIAGVVSLFLPKIIASMKKPRVNFLLGEGKREQLFKMTRAEDGNWEGTINLYVENGGEETLKDYYWHLLIPSALDPQLGHNHGQSVVPKIKPLGEWISWSGRSEAPVFPKSGLTFPYEIKVKNSTQGKFYIYYWFNTEFGVYPAKAKKVDDVHKAIEKGYLGKIEVVAKE